MQWPMSYNNNNNNNNDNNNDNNNNNNNNNNGVEEKKDDASCVNAVLAAMNSTCSVVKTQRLGKIQT